MVNESLRPGRTVSFREQVHREREEQHGGEVDQATGHSAGRVAWGLAAS